MKSVVTLRFHAAIVGVSSIRHPTIIQALSFTVPSLSVSDIYVWIYFEYLYSFPLLYFTGDQSRQVLIRIALSPRQLSCENSNQNIFLYFNTQNYWKPWQPIKHHHSCALNNKWRDNMTRVGVIGMINSGLSIPGPPTTPHYRENYVSLARYWAI